MLRWSARSSVGGSATPRPAGTGSLAIALGSTRKASGDPIVSPIRGLDGAGPIDRPQGAIAVATRYGGLARRPQPTEGGEVSATHSPPPRTVPLRDHVSLYDELTD